MSHRQDLGAPCWVEAFRREYPDLLDPTRPARRWQRRIAAALAFIAGVGLVVASEPAWLEGALATFRSDRTLSNDAGRAQAYADALSRDPPRERNEGEAALSMASQVHDGERVTAADSAEQLQRALEETRRATAIAEDREGELASLRVQVSKFQDEAARARVEADEARRQAETAARAEADATRELAATERALETARREHDADHVRQADLLAPLPASVRSLLWPSSIGPHANPFNAFVGMIMGETMDYLAMSAPCASQPLLSEPNREEISRNDSGASAAPGPMPASLDAAKPLPSEPDHEGIAQRDTGISAASGPMPASLAAASGSAVAVRPKAKSGPPQRRERKATERRSEANRKVEVRPGPSPSSPRGSSTERASRERNGQR